MKDIEWVLKGKRSISFQDFQAVSTSFGKIDAISSPHRPLLFEWFMWTKVGGMPFIHMVQVAVSGSQTSGHLVESLKASQIGDSLKDVDQWLILVSFTLSCSSLQMLWLLSQSISLQLMCEYSMMSSIIANMLLM